MSKVTAYERNLVNALISNTRTTVIELGYSFGVVGTQRPAILKGEHFKTAVRACVVAVNVSEKLDNYHRWDLLSDVECLIMTNRHKEIVANLEAIGFDFKEFVSEVINGKVEYV